MPDSFSIYDRAAALGFDCCGVARCRKLTEHEPRLRAWLERGLHGGLGYMERNVDKRLDPALLVEGARSVVVCALACKRPPTDHPILGRIAAYAWGRDYHFVIREKLDALLASLREAIPGCSGRIFVDTAPLLEKAWAVEAGLGRIGRNRLLIHPVFGSWLMLGVIVTDAELAPDAPLAEEHCSGCRACVDACPTGAITEEGPLDAGRCISRRTIENCLPDEEGPLHGWLFGCDACQSVCPANRNAPAASSPEMAPLPALREMDTEAWLMLDEAAFAERFAGSPLARCGMERLRHRVRSRGND